MDAETRSKVLTAANDAAHKAGLGKPFTGDVKITTHEQFGGEYIGLHLIKAYKPGDPSYLAMILPERGTYRVVTLKRDAMDFEVAA